MIQMLEVYISRRNETMKKKCLRKLVWFIGIISIALLIIIVHSQQPSSATKSYNALNQPLLEIDKQMKEEFKTDDTHMIRHEDIVSLTHQFLEQLVQEVDDDYKVIHFQTKEELLNLFKGISSREVASEYIDFYYVEEGNDLFIVPTELPPWFVADQDYDVVQIANDKVKIVQDNTMELYGNYIIEVEFTFCDNWKITAVHHYDREQGEQVEEDLPLF